MIFNWLIPCTRVLFLSRVLRGFVQKVDSPLPRYGSIAWLILMANSGVECNYKMLEYFLILTYKLTELLIKICNKDSRHYEHNTCTICTVYKQFIKWWRGKVHVMLKWPPPLTEMTITISRMISNEWKFRI